MHVADDPVAAPAHRADRRVGAVALAEEAPRNRYRAIQRVLLDVHVAPDLGEELLARDQPVGVRHEVEQQLEHLRLRLEQRAVAPELEAPGIELELPGLPNR